MEFVRLSLSRRTFRIVAIAATAALILSAGAWWGVARASAQAAADEALAQVAEAQSTARDAHARADSAEADVERMLLMAISPTTDVIAEHAERLDEEATAAIEDVRSAGEDLLAQSHEADLASVFAEAPDGFATRMQWHAEEVMAEIDAEVDRLRNVASEGETRYERANAWTDEAHTALTALATSTIERADSAIESYEHAPDELAVTISERAAELQALTNEPAADATATWEMLPDLLWAHATDVETARTAHLERVEEIEQERREAERREEERKAAEQRARARQNSGGSGGSSGGSGGGSGGGCTFVNWQGMVISTPCP